VAARAGHASILAMLLALGIDVAHADNQGRDVFATARSSHESTKQVCAMMDKLRDLDL
jgi:hypothetical protein